MLPVATLGLLAYAVWRGAGVAGIALMTVGLLVQLALTVRLVRASAGGVGGHAEWVRDASIRPRLRRNPAWLVAIGLVLVGFGVALWG